MITFMFWNLCKKEIQQNIVDLAHKYKVDVLIFAEFKIPVIDLEKALNYSSDKQYKLHKGFDCQKIHIFSHFPKGSITPVSDGRRFSIRKLSLAKGAEILFAGIHFPSRPRARDLDLLEHSRDLITYVSKAEEDAGHRNTILVGDFNMNPFENCFISANGLHAVMSQDIAKKKKRIVRDKECWYFYNPMWNLLGDMTPGPPGTYYYSKGGQESYFWNMFDQVIIRPELVEYFDHNSLEIIEGGNDMSFVGPSGVTGPSDHLPIIFKLNI